MTWSIMCSLSLMWLAGLAVVGLLPQPVGLLGIWQPPLTRSPPALVAAAHKGPSCAADGNLDCEVSVLALACKENPQTPAVEEALLIHGHPIFFMSITHNLLAM